MPNDNQSADTGTSVAKAIGLLDQDKLASIVADKFLTSEEQKASDEKPEAEEPEQDETQPTETQEAEETQPEVVSEETTEEETQKQPEEEEEEDDSSHLPKGLQKRISKLAAKRKAAEEEAKKAAERVKELESQVESLKTGKRDQPSPSTGNALTDFVTSLNSVDEVDREIKSALDIILWAEDHPDGAIVKDSSGNEVEISAEDVRLRKKMAIKLKEIELPARKRYLENESVIKSEVIKEYPWWGKPDTPQYQIANQFLKDFPEIKRRPDWQYIAGIFVEGVTSNAMRKKSATEKAAPVVKKAPAVPKSSAPVSIDPKRSMADKAKDSFRKNPSGDNLAELFKAIGI
jgi:hypothetical protein